MTRKTTLLMVPALALALGGCGGSGPKPKKEPVTGDFDVRSLLGAASTAPDEFAVIAKRPLEMPKDLTSLPAPNPGARSTRTPDAVSEARQALLREDAPTPSAKNVASAPTPSASETALLAAMGASNPNIRELIEADHAEYESEQGLYVLDRIFPSARGLRGADSKDVLQPYEEYKRLHSDEESRLRRKTQDTEIATIPSPAKASDAQARISAEQPASVIPSTSRSVEAVSSPTISTQHGSDSEILYILE